MRRWGIVLGLLVLAVGGYAWAASAVAGKTARTAEVTLRDKTVAVGGMNRSQVSAKVAELQGELSRPVPVRMGDVPAQIVPISAGIALNPDQVASELTSKTWDPSVVLKKLVGRQEVTAEPTVDKAALTSAVEGLAVKVGNSKPVEGAITFAAGKAKPRAAKAGQTVDVAGSVAEFDENWAREAGAGDAQPVELPVRVTQPAVSQKAVDHAMTTTVRPALSAPLTVVVGPTRASVPPARFTTALRMENEKGRLVPRFDADKLRSTVLASSPAIASKPVNARLVFRDGKPRVDPSKTGVTVDSADLAAKATRAITATGAGRTLTVKTQVVQPAVPTSKITALGIRQLMSEYSSRFPYNPPRTHNIRTAVDVVNGTLLQPGQTFDLNQTLGERTPGRGYRKAAVIEGGNLVEGYGGGVSQVATTLFNGVFFAGLEDVEHHPHSLYFSRYPEGREATLAWGGKNLRFRNDSGKGVYLRMWTSGGQVHVQFWGTKKWDIDSRTSGRYNFVQPVKKESNHPRCIAQSPQQGFSVTVTRVFKQGGKVVKTERFRTRYNAEDEITCTHPDRKAA